MTLDFGVAVHPQDGDQKSELIKLADKNLYELKTCKPCTLTGDSNGSATAARSAGIVHSPEWIYDRIRIGISAGCCADSHTNAVPSANARSLRRTAKVGTCVADQDEERMLFLRMRGK